MNKIRNYIKFMKTNIYIYNILFINNFSYISVIGYSNIVNAFFRKYKNFRDMVYIIWITNISIF